MNLNNARFEITAVRPQQYPAGDLPEIALAGRSNVGKSSLINTLLNRKNLARTGSTPGKTREINFYNIDDTLYFVDLPGYGYANVSKTRKASWSTIIETYLNNRQQLKLIIHLLDIRHAPSEEDRVMSAWLTEMKIPFIIAATKADKLNRSQQTLKARELRAALKLTEEAKIITFSALNKLGAEALWEEIKTQLGVE